MGSDPKNPHEKSEKTSQLAVNTEHNYSYPPAINIFSQFGDSVIPSKVQHGFDVIDSDIISNQNTSYDVIDSNIVSNLKKSNDYGVNTERFESKPVNIEDHIKLLNEFNKIKSENDVLKQKNKIAIQENSSLN